jgi:hypothetical protein
MTIARRMNVYFIKLGWQRRAAGWDIYTPSWVWEIRK